MPTTAGSSPAAVSTTDVLRLLTGGARSGKSTLATQMAERSNADVVFVATATAGDAEMADRIARHRADRPAHWRTIEEPVDLTAALAGVPPAHTVVIDCLSLWLMNVLDRDEDEIIAMADEHAAAAAPRPGLTLAVTNEVGSGIVPAEPYTRRYRDLLGRVNATWSIAAEEAYLVVAGRPLQLGDPNGALP